MMRSLCEEWQGARHGHGYGQLYVGGKTVRAHRLIWMQHHGHTDLDILHDCDNPACINMDHLRAGTHTDNMNDMISRGRYKNPVAEERKARTQCPKGHEYTEANTGYYKRDNVRFCKACNRIKARYYQEQKKGAKSRRRRR